MKKRLLAALLTSALALSLTACGGGTDSSATDGGDTASTHDGPYKISMVLKTNAAEFWNIVQAALRHMRMSTRIRSAWTSRVLRLRPTTRSSSTPSRPTLRLSPTTVT